jgi:hypothetical protein
MAIEERFKQHASHGNLLFRAMRKHGKRSFTCEVLLRAPQKQCDQYEQAFIDVYNTVTPMGYNIERGGRGARKRTSDIIARHRAKIIGRKRTGVQLSNITAANKARAGIKNPQSVEGRERIRAAAKKRMAVWHADKEAQQAAQKKRVAVLRSKRCATVQKFHDGLLLKHMVYTCEDGVRRKVVGARFLEVCSHDRAKGACGQCRRIQREEKFGGAQAASES